MKLKKKIYIAFLFPTLFGFMIAAGFFVHLVEIIIIATLVSAVFSRLKQPNILAYIIAGVLIGPLFLGNIDFSGFNFGFEIGIREITPEIELLSELGAAFLLFSIGIETSIKRLFESGKPILAGTILQVIGVIAFTLLLTFFTGLLSFEAAIFVGAIIAFSSTMIVIKLLADRKETDTLHGRLTISILLIQDFLIILAVPILQNISSIGNFGLFLPVFAKSAGLVLIAFFANKFIFPKLFNLASKENELFFLTSISAALVFISLSYILSIPVTIGAFIGGLSLSNLPYNTAIFSKIRALRDFFLTIFFVSLGAGLNFSFTALNPILMIAVLITIFAIKPIVLFLVSLLSGYGSKAGFEIGLILAQASEFGFVIASLGLTTLSPSGEPVLSKELFSFLATTIALSMICTPYLINNAGIFSSNISEKLNKLFKINKNIFFNRRVNKLMLVPTEAKRKGHLIIIGGGLLGRAIAKRIKIGKQVIIVDSNPSVVEEGKKDGLNFTYGTAEDIQLFENLALETAEAMIITVTNIKEALLFISAAKKVSKNIKIIALSNHFYDTMELYEKGAGFVCMVKINGLDELYKKLSLLRESKGFFINEATKKAHLEYIKEMAKEEMKYSKKILK